MSNWLKNLLPALGLCGYSWRCDNTISAHGLAFL